MLKEMFKKTTYIPIGTSTSYEEEKENIGIREKTGPSIPEGLWTKCPTCGKLVYTEDILSNDNICPKCNYYFRVDAYSRIKMIGDEGSFIEWDREIENINPLNFQKYPEKVISLQNRLNMDEAVVTGEATIHGQRIVLAVCDARFLMGSMGQVVGEKITRAVEKATARKLPIIIFTCSGGARMQEGIVSLMQMAKTSAALKKHSEAGLLYITVLTDPTTGGVTASFAMLGDIILAEPGALVGFAGPRVIEQTIGQKLPEGFQRAEFLLEKGLIDQVVKRSDLKNTLSKLIRFHNPKLKLDSKDTPTLNEEKSKKTIEVSSHKTAWEKVEIARSASRPTSLDYIEKIFNEFIELHGDRAFADDGAIIGGIGTILGIPVTVIGQQKGKNTKDNIKRNFGMPYPEGYRKALRLMKQAEKFGRPVICFVDTPGAFCGIGAEERGQGEAIARNLFEMSDLKVPILSIVIGEGGSGGALALAVANEVWMLENSTYSILSPEGFASILWKDNKRAKEAANIMKVTAEDLKELNIIEQIIPEPTVASDKSLDEISQYMKYEISKFIMSYGAKTSEELTQQRYKRFRKM